MNPTTSPAAMDDGIRRRQRTGELDAQVDPAMLRRVLLGAVAAPINFPTMTANPFGVPGSDLAFETHYRDGLAHIITLLAGDQHLEQSRPSGGTHDH